MIGDHVGLAPSQPRSLSTSVVPNVIIAEAIATAAARLADKGVPDARFDAEVLLRYVLTRDRAWIVAHYPDPLNDEVRRRFELLIERRRKDGTWAAQNQHSGLQHFSLGPGAPVRWNTLRAMRVLRWWERDL